MVRARTGRFGREGDMNLLVLWLILAAAGGGLGANWLDGARIDRAKLQAQTAQADVAAAKKLAAAQADTLAKNTAALASLQGYLDAQATRMQAAANSNNLAGTVLEVQPEPGRRDDVLGGHIAATAAALPAPTNDAQALAQGRAELDALKVKDADLQKQLAVEKANATAEAAAADSAAALASRAQSALEDSGRKLGAAETAAKAADEAAKKANSLWGGIVAEFTTWKRHAFVGIGAMALLTLVAGFFAVRYFIRHGLLVTSIAKTVADVETQGAAAVATFKDAVDANLNLNDQAAIKAKVPAARVELAKG